MSQFLEPIGDDDTVCTFCARPCDGRIGSPFGLEAWHALTGEVRDWLPICKDTACGLRLGNIIGWAARVGWRAKRRAGPLAVAG